MKNDIIKNEISEDRRNYDRLQKILIDLFDEKLKPIVKTQEEHHIALYANDGRGGLVKDVNDIKAATLIFKWIIGFIMAVLGLNLFKK